jgi:PAS domain S-box-containing protein
MSGAAEKEKNIKELRKQAEKKSGGKIVKLSGLSVKNTSRLIQELRVHQIEMEMQNDELRKVQKELEDSRNKYFSLFDFAPVGYFTLNQKNLIEEVNLTAAEMLRIERSGLKRQKFTQYIVPDYQDAFYLHRKKIFDTNSRQTCELRFMRKDGNQFDAQLISVPCQAPDGSFSYLRMAVTDISDRKQAEVALKAQYAKLDELKEIINRSGSLVFVWRIEPGKWPVEFVSDNVENISGYSVDDFISGRVLWPSITHQDDVPRLEKEMAQYLEKGARKWSQEYHLITKSGKVRWFHEDNLSFADSAGRIIRIQAIIHDITEHKKMEQEIKNYQKRLKFLASRLSLSKEHEKQKIASGLHDNICQRLALSKFNLQLSIKSISGAETLNSLTSVCVEIDNIIKDIHLLTFELSNPVLNELGLTVAVEKYLAEEIQEKHGIRFELNSNLKNKELTATIRGCLYRNTHELLWNIIKHASAHQVKVLIHKSADHINVCVEDDGIGFDTGRIAMLPTRNEGFGLFSIREQLEYLGGNIRIESNVGGGTKVSMTLPLKPEESVHL